MSLPEFTLARYAAAVIAFIGLCLLLGWVQVYRDRRYLLWLAIAFLSLGSNLWLPRGEYVGPRRVLLAVTLVTLIAAVVEAIVETRRRLARIRAQHRAREEALLEMVKASAQKKGEE